jgi:hypothetical protein
VPIFILLSDHFDIISVATAGHLGQMLQLKIKILFLTFFALLIQIFPTNFVTILTGIDNINNNIQNQHSFTKWNKNSIGMI